MTTGAITQTGAAPSRMSAIRGGAAVVKPFAKVGTTSINGTTGDSLEKSKNDILSPKELQSAADDYFDDEKVEVRVDASGQVHVKCLSGDVTMSEIKAALGLKDGVIRENNNIESDNGNTKVSYDNRNWFQRWFGGGPWLDNLSLREGKEITVPMSAVGQETGRTFFTTDLVEQIRAVQK